MRTLAMLLAGLLLAFLLLAGCKSGLTEEEKNAPPPPECGERGDTPKAADTGVPGGGLAASGGECGKSDD